MNAFAGMSPMLRAYLFQMPYYAVWITGICLCLSRWQRHRKVCGVAMTGFSLLFIESLVGILFSYYLLPRMLGGSGSRNTWVYNMIWLGRSMLHAGFWCLILVAIFGWRNERRHNASEHAGYVRD